VFGEIVSEGIFKLKSLPFELDIERVYRKVKFSSDANESE
jgi:hypothetical protein